MPALALSTTSLPSRPNGCEIVAGNVIALAQRLGEAARGFLQQQVADLVAKRVVDPLEAIEVEREHRQHFAGAPDPRHGVVHLVLEQVPVRQTGQAVVQRKLADPLLGALALGDVLDGPLHQDRFAGAIVTHFSLLVHDANRAVGTHDAEVDI